MVTPFPVPPRLVRQALDDLHVAAAEDDTAGLLGPAEDWQRPWDPSTCTGELRYQLWCWLDEVAAWINQEHAWQTSRLVPDCWPEHPHIIRQLATLACQRYYSGLAITPDPLDEWQRYSLPGLLNHLSDTLAGTTCQHGKHKARSAGTRRTDSQTEFSLARLSAVYREDVIAEADQRRAHADSEP